MQQIESEWLALKELVRRSAAAPARWRESPDRLQLNDAAAQFLNGYRVRFGLVTPVQGATLDEPPPVDEWQLTAKLNASPVVWFAPEFHRDFSTAELAEKIVERLVRYSDDCTHAREL
jgi:hypothetical protein